MSDNMITISSSEYESLVSRALVQEDLDSLRAAAERLPELEQAAGERNTLRMDLADAQQERDRLKQLLLDVVRDLEAFSMDYPPAGSAHVAFQGSTSEEVVHKMAVWDEARAQKASEWDSLVNHVRTQATV